MTTYNYPDGPVIHRFSDRTGPLTRDPDVPVLDRGELGWLLEDIEDAWPDHAHRPVAVVRQVETAVGLLRTDDRRAA